MTDARRRWGNLPLRLRLTLWYTASLALILFLLGTFVYLQLRRSLLTQMDIGLQVAATQSLINIQAQGGRLAFVGLETNPDIAHRLNNDFVVINLMSPDGSPWDRMGEDDRVSVPPLDAAGYRTLTSPTEQWRVYDQPVTVGGVTGRLQVVQELESVNLTLYGLLRQMLLAAPLALLAAALGGFFLASRALAPVDRITRTARAITAHDLRRRIDYHGPQDEIGRLAVTLDDMLGRLETGFERERRFTADAAHELRTPLTALKGRLGVTLSRPRSPSVYMTTLVDMEGQVDRLVRLSNDLLLMSRLQQDGAAIMPERIELHDFLASVVDQARPLADVKAITLTLEVAGEPVMDGRMDLLTRLFLNLLDNAVKYTPREGRVSVSAGQEGPVVTIRINDTGPGIAPEHLPHLFERFYRAEGDRARRWDEDDPGGAGLGLALAQEIARLHGGGLSVESEVGRGTTFIARFPVRSGGL